MTTPRLLSERYELGDTLGYGGMSEVHKGRDVRLSRDVAVKVLRADLARDPQFQLRFRREAQNAAALNHPAIVAVYDTGEVESEFGPLPYIVMEFVDGQTLREIVKGTGPLSQQRVIEVMADVCAALDFSHRHGIIHRDVKPANIMITKSGAVKVMDFGIARALADGQNMTQTAAVIGTAQYLSPEQARGEAVDARSDVYAAGCVLFELLTGEPPFSGDSPVAVAYQHVREDVRSPSTVNTEVPHELDAIVLKAMSKNPANRYQSSSEMRSDLVRVLRGQRPLAPAVMTEEERTALLHGGMGGATGTGATRRISTTQANRHAAPPSWETDDPNRRSTGKMIGIAVGVLALVAVVAFVATRIFGPVDAQTVSIPSVAGLTQDQARTALNNLHLKLSVQQENSQAQANYATRTDPPSGSDVTEQQPVTLYISKGPGQAKVPDLTGKSAVDAQSALQNVGLSLAVDRKNVGVSDPSKVDKIIDQNPKPNAQVPSGTSVTITIGFLQPTVQIPQVVGLTVSQATQSLSQVGLKSQVSGGDGSANQTVVSATPAPGQQAAQGSTVTMSVSGTSGDQVRMPSVTGLSKDDARDQLQSSGINRDPDVRNVNTPNSDQDGKVIQQSPASGQATDPDSRVTLYVGKYSQDASSNNNNGNRGNNGGGGLFGN
jgi:serine/threonine-protein kinase